MSRINRLFVFFCFALLLPSINFGMQTRPNSPSSPKRTKSERKIFTKFNNNVRIHVAQQARKKIILADLITILRMNQAKKDKNNRYIFESMDHLQQVGRELTKKERKMLSPFPKEKFKKGAIGVIAEFNRNAELRNLFRFCQITHFDDQSVYISLNLQGENDSIEHKLEELFIVDQEKLGKIKLDQGKEIIRSVN